MKKLLFLSMVLLTIPFFAAKAVNYDFRFSDDFRSIDGKYNIFLDPAGPKKAGEIKFDVSIENGEISVSGNDSGLVNINADNSLSVDADRTCKQYKARALRKGIGWGLVTAGIGAAAAAAPHVDLTIRGLDGDLNGAKGTIKFKLACQHKTFTVDGDVEQKKISIED